MTPTIDPPATDLSPPIDFPRLFASPCGRAFHLSFMAHAEDADEGIFDALLERVAPPDLLGLVRVHTEDERRHAVLLRACVERTGLEVAVIPEELRYIERLRQAAGGGSVNDVFAEGDVSLMRLFAMLQVVEERGVEQFPLVEQALRAFDPESADVVAAITHDERRHVKYAEAISRRYAPDLTALAEFTALCRSVEAQAFTDTQQAYAAFAERHGLYDAAA